MANCQLLELALPLHIIFKIMAEDYQKGREDDEVGRCGIHSDTIDLNGGL